MNKKKLYSVNELSEMMDVSRVTVYNWIRQGLAGKMEHRIGKKDRMVFCEDDLLEYFEVETMEELMTQRRK